MNDKYAAQRALNQLDAEREAGWMTDTQLFGQRLAPIVADPDDTVPMLPALLRPQAD